MKRFAACSRSSEINKIDDVNNVYVTNHISDMIIDTDSMDRPACMGYYHNLSTVKMDDITWLVAFINVLADSDNQNISTIAAKTTSTKLVSYHSPRI